MGVGGIGRESKGVGRRRKSVSDCVKDKDGMQEEEQEGRKYEGDCKC